MSEEKNLPDLPKWPHMVAWGEPVTPQQAEDINLRTSHLDFCTNARNTARKMYQVMGVEVEDDGFYPSWHRDEQALLERAGNITLNLEYLTNANILSSWVGGPHGWCSWDGTIGCRGYNIGKWPRAETVFREWEVIAQTFPYLDLTCVLFDREACEYDSKPVIQYRIRDGKVEVSTEVDPIPEPFPGTDYQGGFSHLFSQPSGVREVGISVSDFAEAWGRHMERMGERT